MINMAGANIAIDAMADSKKSPPPRSSTRSTAWAIRTGCSRSASSRSATICAWPALPSPPVCAGERLATIYGFRELLMKQGVAVINPDITNVGGMAECRKVAAMAQSAYISVAPHNPNGPLATAASAHLAASIPIHRYRDALRTDLEETELEGGHPGQRGSSRTRAGDAILASNRPTGRRPQTGKVCPTRETQLFCSAILQSVAQRRAWSGRHQQYRQDGKQK
jgi:Enolase C-terminal domain-like